MFCHITMYSQKDISIALEQERALTKHHSGKSPLSQMSMQCIKSSLETGAGTVKRVHKTYSTKKFWLPYAEMSIVE